MLLVLGTSFIVGGFKHLEQQFNVTVAQTSSSLMFIPVAGFIMAAVVKEVTEMSKGKLTYSIVLRCQGKD